MKVVLLDREVNRLKRAAVRPAQLRCDEAEQALAPKARHRGLGAHRDVNRRVARERRPDEMGDVTIENRLLLSTGARTRTAAPRLVRATQIERELLFHLKKA